MGRHHVLAVGNYIPSQRSPAAQTFVLQWDGSRWNQVAGLNLDTANNTFAAVAAEGTGGFWVVGSTGYGNYYPLRPLIARYSGLLCWQPTALPFAPPTAPASPIPTGSPTAPLPPTGLPTTRVADPHLPGVLYFPQSATRCAASSAPTGRRMAGWLSSATRSPRSFPRRVRRQAPSNGAVFRAGTPGVAPENRPPYDMLLGLLGRTVTAGRRPKPRSSPSPRPTRPPGATSRIQGIDRAGSAYWETHGGLAIYGYPISDPFTEVNQADGQPYLVQYFERNRLEYHPDCRPLPREPGPARHRGLAAAGLVAVKREA